MGKRSRLKREQPAVTTAAIEPAPRSEPLLAVCIALIVAIVIIYARVGTHNFITYDDPTYVTNNAHVQEGLTLTSLRWAFTSLDFNWHPLTWITLLTDISLFGAKAGPILYGNVALHIASTLILLFLLRLTTGDFWRSSAVAALFAVHPLRVESVAWIAERKDVLCALFFLLSLFYYARWTKESSRSAYIASLAMFALGLMSKGMIVTLPFVLLLLDYWPLNRFDLKRGLIEKIPFFLLMIPGIVMTWVAQAHVHALAKIELVSPAARAANAVLSYVAYIGKMLWPSGLAIPYPLRLVLVRADVFEGTVVLVIITALVWLARTRHPYLLTGWLWYLGILVPVIGLVQIGSQSMADRYTYLPQIGLAFALVWFLASVIPQRAILGGAAAIAILTLGALAFVQTGYWKDSETLYRHSIAVTERNSIAHRLLGGVLMDQGRYREAAEEFQRTLAISPNDDMARPGLVLAMAKAGPVEGEEGLALARAGVEANPQSAEAHNNLAILLARAGKDQEALVEYRETLRLDPHQYDGHMNLGALLSRMNDDAGANAEFEAAAQEQPKSVEPHVYLALNHAAAGRKNEAIREARIANSIDRAAADSALTTALRRPLTMEGFINELH